MTNDCKSNRTFTGLGMYFLGVSTCSLVHYHPNQKISASNPAHLIIRFDKGGLSPLD